MLNNTTLDSSFLPQSAFLIASCILVLQAQAMFISLLFWSCCGCYSKDQVKNHLKYPILHKVVRRAFPILSEGPTPNTTVLLGYKVPDSYILKLMNEIRYITVIAIATFWQKFLIQEVSFQSGLKNSLFCYEKQFFAYDLINCNEINCFNDDIVCYQVVFAFGEAFTTAAGILTFYYGLATLMSVNGVILKTTGDDRKMKCTGRFVALLVILISMVLVTIFYLFMRWIFRSNGYIYQIISDVNHSLIVIINVWSCISIKWWTFEKIPEQKHNLITSTNGQREKSAVIAKQISSPRAYKQRRHLTTIRRRRWPHPHHTTPSLVTENVPSLSESIPLLNKDTRV